MLMDDKELARSFISHWGVAFLEPDPISYFERRMEESGLSGEELHQKEAIRETFMDSYAEVLSEEVRLVDGTATALGTISQMLNHLVCVDDAPLRRAMAAFGVFGVNLGVKRNGVIAVFPDGAVFVARLYSSGGSVLTKTTYLKAGVVPVTCEGSVGPAAGITPEMLLARLWGFLAIVAEEFRWHARRKE